MTKPRIYSVFALIVIGCGSSATVVDGGSAGSGGQAGGAGRGSAGAAGSSGRDGGGAAGSSAGNADSSVANCTESLTPGATMAWQDDGTAECAVDVGATLMTSPGSEVLELIGAEVMSVSIGFTVTGNPPLAGPYFCEPTTTSAAFYYSSSSIGYEVQSCTVTVNSVGAPGGANASGTFSAILNLPSGATKTISNGTFDAPVVAIGG